MGEGSKYSDELKVACLAEYDLDGRIRTTARKFNVPPSTLTDWIAKRKSGELDVPNVVDRVERSKKQLIEKTKSALDMALDVVIDKIEDCNAYQAATVYGILSDKLARMEGIMDPSGGNTTNNLIINNMSKEDISKLLGRAMSRMQPDVIEGECREVKEE